MFESDDYDQILSQVDLNEFDVKLPENTEKQNALQTDNFHKNTMQDKNLDIHQLLPGAENHLSAGTSENSNRTFQNTSHVTFTHNRNSTKRKIINSYFDLKSKRKFPGPAGLLSSKFKGKYDDVCDMELSSQDIDYMENCLNENVFDTPLWKKILKDTESLKEINCIEAIKQKAQTGNLPGKKAQFVRAFIQSIDRSNVDPLIILRDETDYIKCTLHRDAWKAFSTQIVSECSAIVLRKPSVLTIGRPLKNHYLIITLNNIFAIYSSAVKNNDSLPDGYQKFYEEDCTVIKMDGPELSKIETVQNSIDDLNDLDDVFLDDMF